MPLPPKSFEIQSTPLVWPAKVCWMDTCICWVLILHGLNPQRFLSISLIHCLLIICATINFPRSSNPKCLGWEARNAINMRQSNLSGSVKYVHDTLFWSMWLHAWPYVIRWTSLTMNSSFCHGFSLVSNIGFPLASILLPIPSGSTTASALVSPSFKMCLRWVASWNCLCVLWRPEPSHPACFPFPFMGAWSTFHDSTPLSLAFQFGQLSEWSSQSLD